MKRTLAGALAALLTFSAYATTFVPPALINPAGSTSGQALLSTGPTGAVAWGSIGLGNLPQAAANTVLGNGTASTAVVTALAVPSCSAAGSALKWTSATGFSCGTGYGLTANPLSQFAATTSAQLAGVISDETGSGALVFANGGAINPTSTGSTTPGIGAFTTLNGSSNDALLYQTTAAQSIPSGTATTVTTFTKVFDRDNANFNASTGVFTAPATAWYVISGQITFASSAWTAANAIQLTAVANGVTVSSGLFTVEVTGTFPVTVVLPTTFVSLTSGQTLVVQAFQNNGVAHLLSASGVWDFVSIGRIP